MQASPSTGSRYVSVLKKKTSYKHLSSGLFCWLFLLAQCRLFKNGGRCVFLSLQPAMQNSLFPQNYEISKAYLKQLKQYINTFFTVIPNNILMKFNHFDILIIS